MLALVALTVAAYANALTTGFAYDSRQLVLQDARVHALTADNVDQILHHTYWWPYGESGLYRPATTLSFLLNAAGRVDPLPFHAANLLLHLVNVLLVWRLVIRIARDADAAFAAAAIWAVLPVSVEAVTNVAGRADLLAACGVLAALLLYRRSWLGVSAATTLAVFSKESAIVVAPLALACEVAAWDRKTSRRALAAGAIAIGIPLIAMWGARSAVLSAAPPAEFPFVDNPIVGASWLAARLTALKTTGLYLWKLGWPARLSADYSFAAIALADGRVQDWLGAATVGLVLCAMTFAARRSPSAAFFAVFAIVAFLPVSNLLFAAGTIFGERLLYLPSVGIAALVGLGLARLPRRAHLVMLASIVIAFAVRTAVRNRDWADDLTLWRAAAAAEPASAKTHHALAEALYESDPSHARIDATIAEQERAVAILAAVPDDRNWLQAFRQAGAYHLDKATALKAEGMPEYDRARQLLERALAIYDAGARRYGAPNPAVQADIDRLLASSYLGVHDAEHAIAAAGRARDLEPLAPLPYRQIATAQLAREEPDAAAVTLMVGSIVTADRGLTQALLGLYAAGLDADGCAAASGPSGPTLNTTCAVVQRHLCAAAPEAAKLDRQLGRFTEAERVEATARAMGMCKGT